MKTNLELALNSEIFDSGVGSIEEEDSLVGSEEASEVDSEVDSEDDSEEDSEEGSAVLWLELEAGSQVEQEHSLDEEPALWQEQRERRHRIDRTAMGFLFIGIFPQFNC